MVFLYYISTYLLKINGVFGTRASLGFIKNLALLSLLSFKTENSSDTKISVLSVCIPIKPNTLFLVVIRKQGL
jgi:hypothetical protein